MIPFVLLRTNSGDGGYNRTCHVLWSLFFFLFSAHSYFPAPGQDVVTGVVPSSPRFLPSIFIAHRVQQSHCLSAIHRVLLTHVLALSASQLAHEKKSLRIYTSMHSAALCETDLYQARGSPDTPPGRPDHHTYCPDPKQVK